MTLKPSKDTLRPTTRNTEERNDNQESNQMENDLWPQAEEISMNPQNIDHVERPPEYGSLPCWNIHEHWKDTQYNYYWPTKNPLSLRKCQNLKSMSNLNTTHDISDKDYQNCAKSYAQKKGNITQELLLIIWSN